MDEISKPGATPIAGNLAVASGSVESFTPPVRVWLVDDNDGIRTLVAELLSLQGGIECARHFSSPDDLLSTLASKPGPDVILLDVQMGERNGLDAVRPIKSLTRSTRVLMFTACRNPDWQKRAFDEGASDYLLKSDTMERVAARIRSAAHDPAPDTRRRRRSSRLTGQPLPGLQAGSAGGKTSRLFNRTLQMLGLNN